MAQGDIGTTVSINIFSDLGQVFSGIDLAQSALQRRAEETLEKVSMIQPVESHVPEMERFDQGSGGRALAESIAARQQKDLTLSNWLRESLRAPIKLPESLVTNIKDLSLRDLLPTLKGSSFPLIEAMYQKGGWTPAQTKQFDIWEERVKDRLQYSTVELPLQEKSFNIPEIAGLSKEPITIPQLVNPEQIALKLFEGIPHKEFSHEWQIPQGKNTFEYEIPKFPTINAKSFEVYQFESQAHDLEIPSLKDVSEASFELPTFEVSQKEYPVFEFQSKDRYSIITPEFPAENEISYTLPEFPIINEIAYTVPDLSTAKHFEVAIPETKAIEGKDFTFPSYQPSETTIAIPEATSLTPKDYQAFEFPVQEKELTLSSLPETTYETQIESPTFSVPEISITLPDLAHEYLPLELPKLEEPTFKELALSELISPSVNPVELTETTFAEPSDIELGEIPLRDRTDIQVMLPERAPRSEIRLDTKDVFASYEYPEEFKRPKQDFGSQLAASHSEIDTLFGYTGLKHVIYPTVKDRPKNDWASQSMGFYRNTGELPNTMEEPV